MLNTELLKPANLLIIVIVSLAVTAITNKFYNVSIEKAGA